jgi:hypothetical protein
MNCPKCGKGLWFLRDFCPFCKTKIIAAPRPKAVKILSWLFLVLGCLALVTLLAAKLPSGFTPGARFQMFAVAALLAFAAGFTLLGHNWARWLLVSVLALNFGYGVMVHVTVGVMVARGLAAAIAAYYLFRPDAKAFFVGEPVICGEVEPAGAEATAQDAR